MLTHLNVLMNVARRRRTPSTSRPTTCVLGCLPLFHTFGQTCCMNTALLRRRVGRHAAALRRAPALDLLVKEKCTIFMGVPTMYVALLDRPARRASPARRCKSALSGGAALPEAVLEEFERGLRHQGARGLRPDRDVAGRDVQPDRPSSPSRAPSARPSGASRSRSPRPSSRTRIELLPTGEIGEIVVRGHNVFKGYLNKPEATAAAIVDGWFRTGDLGTKDEEGYVRIVDRKKDMVLRGGYNVYPRDVEEVLLRHPAVGQVAVIGLPDPQYGEEVCAVVVKDPEGEDATEDEIKAWSKERLASYKYPRRVIFADAFPLGPSGKVLKRELVVQYSEQQ